MVTVFNKPISNETHTMTGATSENPGTAGLAPAPAIGDQTKVLTGAGIWGLPGVVTINGRAPNPVTGDIVVIEGGGSSNYGSYRLDATITPSDWVASNGAYVAVVSNQYITSGMDGSETWLDNEYAQLGDAEFVSGTGTLTITTTVQPTENWNLHASLAVNGADVLADVSAIRTSITDITTNLGSPTSASGVTGADAFSKINTINNLVGAVPSGETVEGQITSLNSNITLRVTQCASLMTVERGGTVGAVVPSLTASYAKFGNLVHLTFMFWGGTIEGANSDGLILKLPLPASTKTDRYYGHIGFTNAGVTDIYTVISASNATLANQIAFVNHNASGSEVSVSGTQMNTRTVQGDIWYFTE